MIEFECTCGNIHTSVSKINKGKYQVTCHDCERTFAYTRYTGE